MVKKDSHIENLDENLKKSDSSTEEKETKTFKKTTSKRGRKKASSKKETIKDSTTKKDDSEVKSEKIPPLLKEYNNKEESTNNETSNSKDDEIDTVEEITGDSKKTGEVLSDEDKVPNTKTFGQNKRNSKIDYEERCRDLQELLELKDEELVRKEKKNKVISWLFIGFFISALFTLIMFSKSFLDDYSKLITEAKVEKQKNEQLSQYLDKTINEYQVLENDFNNANNSISEMQHRDQQRIQELGEYKTKFNALEEDINNLNVVRSLLCK